MLCFYFILFSFYSVLLYSDLNFRFAISNTDFDSLGGISTPQHIFIKCLHFLQTV